MKLVIGLGNPGHSYKNTRHNAGFLALDDFLAGRGGVFCQSKFRAQTLELHLDGEKILFVKPETFMNESGEAARQLRDFYRLRLEDVLAIHDDVDLPLGEVRLTHSSSAAGHNGVKSLIQQLDSQDFSRVRIGIETRQSREQLPTEAFVLQTFSPEEMELLTKEAFPKTRELIARFLQKQTPLA